MRQIETNAYCNLKQTHSHSHTFHIHTFTFSHLHFQTFPFHSDTFTDTLSLSHFHSHTFSFTLSLALSLSHFHSHTLNFYTVTLSIPLDGWDPYYVSLSRTARAVCPSLPSFDGRARLDGLLWKIARLAFL